MKRKRKGISAGIRWKVFNRDGFRCIYCGAGKEASLVIDHGDPFSKGGDDDESNYVTACRSCNAGKRDKVVIPPPAEEVVDDCVMVDGVAYSDPLHADWAAALRQVCVDVSYKPHPVKIECGVTGSEGDEIVYCEFHPDFLCLHADSSVGCFYVVTVPWCDVCAMRHGDKVRMRNGAILGYKQRTALIIGSPYRFQGFLVEKRHKGCPDGRFISECLDADGYGCLSGWYPDENWDAADPREYELIHQRKIVFPAGWRLAGNDFCNMIAEEHRNGL